jgi:hypothetical protein
MSAGQDLVNRELCQNQQIQSYTRPAETNYGSLIHMRSLIIVDFLIELRPRYFGSLDVRMHGFSD